MPTTIPKLFLPLDISYNTRYNAEHMLRKVVTIASITALSFVAAPAVFAGETCNPTYGGQCPDVKVTIDKKVANPNATTTTTKGGKTVTEEVTKLEYLDNIAASDTDKRYSPTQKIVFKLTVTNTSDQVVKNVVVTDKLPLDTVSNISTNGTFDAEKKTVTIKVDEMKAKESKDFYITGTIVTADRLPSEQPVICSVNQSFVSVANTQVDEDNAGFCIGKETGTVTKGGKPVHEAPNVTSTPPTGPELFALIPLVGSATAGFILRRKSR